MAKLPVNIDLKIDATEAVTETSKTLNDGIRFFASLIAPGMQDVANAVNKKVNLWSLRNIEKINLKRLELVKARGGEGEEQRPIPTGIAYKLTEASSEEEADEIQNLWAKLIDEAIRADGTFEIDKVFIETLSRLTPIDTVILSFIRARKELNSLQQQQEIKIIGDRFPKEHRIASLASLERLRLIENDIGLSPILRVAKVANNPQIDLLSLRNAFLEIHDVLNSRDPYRNDFPEERFRLTEFGDILVRRCM